MESPTPNYRLASKAPRRRICYMRIAAWIACLPAIAYASGDAPPRDGPLEAFRLPAAGEVRIAYVTFAQTPEFDGIPWALDTRHLRLPGSGTNNDSNDVTKPRIAEDIRRSFTPHTRGRALLRLATEDVDTTLILAQTFGAITREAKRMLPETPILLLVNSVHFAMQLDLAWDPFKPPFPVPKDDSERLAVLGRNRILFATDARAGTDTDLKLLLDASGQLSPDPDRSDVFKKMPKRPEVYVLTLTLQEEDKLTCTTLGLAVGQIVKASERSLDKSAAARPATTRATAVEVDTVKKLLTELDADDWRQRATAQDKLIDMGAAAIEPLRNARPWRSPDVQQSIDAVLRAFEIQHARRPSMVLYIRSPALLAELTKAGAPRTTRPAQ